MYTVALFYSNLTGEYYVYTENKTEINKEEIENLESLGYRLESCIITTNKLVALKARLKAKIHELRSLKPDVDYLGYDTALINQIGIITSRLLSNDVEVTDEIALQCLDIRNSKVHVI